MSTPSKALRPHLSSSYSSQRPSSGAVGGTGHPRRPEAGDSDYPSAPAQGAADADVPESKSPIAARPGSRETASGASPGSKAEQHKRVYQACSNCRERKVKCDLGSVDNPSDPPCQRCRRESKECFFSATRRKRKSDVGHGPDRGSADHDETDEAYLRRNRRKLLGTGQSPLEHPALPPPLSTRSTDFGHDTLPEIDRPRTPNGSIGRPFPLRKPAVNGAAARGETPEERVSNTHAQKLMSEPVYGPHDALELLYAVALEENDGDRNGKKKNIQRPHLQQPADLVPPQQPHIIQPELTVTKPELRTTSSHDVHVDPALYKSIDMQAQERQLGYKDAIKAWRRFKFVRTGLLTPKQAINYIEYYYKYMSPLTPISPPTFRDPATHVIMLNEEPILTMTLLTIASRYCPIPAEDTDCRSHQTHDQMWLYLRGMVERCVWGQEAFGNGFYNAGGPRHGNPGVDTSTTDPERGLRKGSLRTLGTVESLMILTEWQPRALVFPPSDVTDELMLPSYDQDKAGDSDEEGGIGGRRVPGKKETWLEPAWRTGRMSWMLLTTAMGLAYELGVFDDTDEATQGDYVSRPEYKDEDYRVRAARIKKLLLIYITQLSGRLNWTNMVPENLRSGEFNPGRRRRNSTDGRTPDTATTNSGSFVYVPNLEHDDAVIHCWAGISDLMRIGNERLYKSRAYTDRIIRDGTYLNHLMGFQSMLKTWKSQFDRFQMPTHIRHILQIEYEYARMYLNSLSLHSVTRCIAKAASNARRARSGLEEHVVMSLNNHHHHDPMPLTTLEGPGPEDGKNIQEVIDAGRSLLRTVVHDLRPNDYLKHVPIRIYMHIVSGAMMLFKTFQLPVAKSDMLIGFNLIDETATALRSCVVDDAHLISRITSNLTSLVSSSRGKFEKVSVVQQPYDASKQNSRRASPELRRAHLDVRGTINEWNNKTPSFAGPGSVASDPTQPSTPVNHQYFFTPFPRPFTPGGSAAVFDDQALGLGTGPANDDYYYLPPDAQLLYDPSDTPTAQTFSGVAIGGSDMLNGFMVEDFPGSNFLF